MSYELNEGQVSIFKNEKKLSESHPDYKGSVMINGVEKDIALWIKDTKNGKKYFSGKISEKFKKSEPKAESQELPPIENDLLF
jgi:uncharacterized protein (DUF736 family)